MSTFKVPGNGPRVIRECAWEEARRDGEIEELKDICRKTVNSTICVCVNDYCNKAKDIKVPSLIGAIIPIIVAKIFQ